MTTGSETLEYGQFTASANNDCPRPDSPTAVTIEGSQTDVGFAMVFCLPHPDEIENDTAIAFGEETVQLIDVNGRSGDCIISLDRSVALDATITFAGYCGNGVASAGFSLQLDGTVGGLRTCGTDPAAPITLTLSGRVATVSL